MAEFVKDKDLKPGKLYFFGDGHTGVYVYLGLNKDEDYVWYNLFMTNVTANRTTPIAFCDILSTHPIQSSLYVTTRCTNVREFTQENLKHFEPNAPHRKMLLEKAKPYIGCCLDMSGCTAVDLEDFTHIYYTGRVAWCDIMNYVKATNCEVGYVYFTRDGIVLAYLGNVGRRHVFLHITQRNINNVLRRPLAELLETPNANQMLYYTGGTRKLRLLIGYTQCMLPVAQQELAYMLLKELRKPIDCVTPQMLAECASVAQRLPME